MELFPRQERFYEFFLSQAITWWWSCERWYSCAQTVQLAFVALETKQPLPYCIEVNRLEEVADQLIRDADHHVSTLALPAFRAEVWAAFSSSARHSYWERRWRRRWVREWSMWSSSLWVILGGLVPVPHTRCSELLLLFQASSSHFGGPRDKITPCQSLGSLREI
jgi:hypothetical protein